jgi:hypothetical protein
LPNNLLVYPPRCRIQPRAIVELGVGPPRHRSVSEDARRFYVALGFDPCGSDSMTLGITLADAQSAINPST